MEYIRSIEEIIETGRRLLFYKHMCVRTSTQGGGRAQNRDFENLLIYATLHENQGPQERYTL